MRAEDYMPPPLARGEALTTLADRGYQVLPAYLANDREVHVPDRGV